MEEKPYITQTQKESLNDRRILVEIVMEWLILLKMKYQWALNLWDTMEANTWFPKRSSNDRWCKKIISFNTGWKKECMI